MDLYTLLGVARSASADEIDRAYRRLARRYHPGVNPGDVVAADLYRQVQQAHAILADLDRRRDYDRGTGPAPFPQAAAAVSFDRFDFSALAEGPGAATFSELFADVFQDAARRAREPDHGAPLEVTLRLSFDAAVRGGDFPLSVLRQEHCARCRGAGRVPQAPAVCPDCAGHGARQWSRGHMVFTKACETCGGEGRTTSQACRACGGHGAQPQSEVVTVRIPPGIDRGSRVAVPGRGHAGALGEPAGDLYVTVDVADHPFFRREGRDVCLTLPVAVHEAALGARVEVPTLDGPTRLRIPPGTQSGQRFRLRGRGVPPPPGAAREAAGDLVVDVQIVLPPVRDERSRELLKEFGRLNEVDVRQHLFDRRA
jgi:molecular chaperone DnaJ